MLRTLAIGMVLAGAILAGTGWFPPQPQPNPGPGPGPSPPPPPGPRHIVVVEESGDRTPAWASVFERLQSKYERVSIVDVDTTLTPYRDYVRAVDRRQLPYLFVVTQEGQPVHTGPCPSEFREVEVLLDGLLR